MLEIGNLRQKVKNIYMYIFIYAHCIEVCLNMYTFTQRGDGDNDMLL